MIRYQEAAYDLEALRVPKMLYDLGRPDILEELSNYMLDYDQYWEIVTVAADLIFKSVVNDSDISGDHHISVYSDPAMKEFYRLARRYSSKTKISLKQNPYLLKAKAVVDRYLNIDSSSSGYELHTKAKNCCVVFYYDCFFNEQEELLEGLIEILNYYRQQSAALRKVLGVTPIQPSKPPI